MLPETEATPEDHTLHRGPKPAREAHDLDVGQPLDYLTGEEVNAAARAGLSQAMGPVEDDFTRIKGIGPVFDRRLKEAGVRTFADLAATPAEQIAEIVGWPLERVTRSDIPGQARHFAENQ
jgi:predicted flap endonuclease-1-like 5' DNA nuclease